jgi:uncharacterized damage-inducible protein DinB
MFRRLSDFTACWTQESAKTSALLEALSGPDLDQPLADGHRTLRRLAWHLVEALVEMPGHLGLAIEGRELIHDSFISAPPATVAQIVQAYRAASDSLLAGLAAWTDADLEREDDMYGQRWQRGFTLQALTAHQTHHRGQMTVLMRQAGLKPTDCYGPTREGWAAYGMAAPAV